MHKPTPDAFPQQKPVRTAQRVVNLAAVATSQLQNRSAKPSSADATSEPKRVDPLRMELLEQLWITMVETYGHRWTANFGVIPKPDHAWAKHLTGISGRQLANGLAALSSLENDGWPPSAPQFRAMCLNVPGLPTEEEAWDQALRGEYGHDAVRVAAKQTGTYDLRTARPDNKTLRKTFARNYSIVRARAVMGKPLEDTIPLGIEHEHKSPMQVQFAHSHQQARDLMQAQGIPSDPAQARAMLLAKMRIRRDNHA